MKDEDNDEKLPLHPMDVDPLPYKHPNLKKSGEVCEGDFYPIEVHTSKSGQEFYARECAKCGFLFPISVTKGTFITTTEPVPLPKPNGWRLRKFVRK